MYACQQSSIVTQRGCCGSLNIAHTRKTLIYLYFAKYLALYQINWPTKSIAPIVAVSNQVVNVIKSLKT